MTQKPENNESVLSRWSRRKLDKQTATEHELAVPSEPKPALEPTPTADQPIVDETELPLWQQLDVDPEVKKAALSRLFHQPEFNVVDRMNEYADDFTSFASLGNVVTQQMKHMLKLAEQKTRPGEQQAGEPDLDNMADTETASADEQTAHINETSNDNEGNEIA